MTNTYTQINIHCVLAVKGRENQIEREFRDELFRYMSGIIKGASVYPLAIGGFQDHFHVFFELHLRCVY